MREKRRQLIRNILTQKDEFGILHKSCAEVTEFGDGLLELVTDMWDSMYAAGGVGLAATQIGSSLRVAVIDTLRTSNSYRNLVMVNPHIEEFSGKQTADEGCLSMPGLRWPITRAETVTVTYQDVKGKKHGRSARGLLARAIQHECDHLNGVLCNSLA